MISNGPVFVGPAIAVANGFDIATQVFGMVTLWETEMEAESLYCDCKKLAGRTKNHHLAINPLRGLS
jgi:hypothetical protein